MKPCNCGFLWKNILQCREKSKQFLSQVSHNLWKWLRKIFRQVLRKGFQVSFEKILWQADFLATLSLFKCIPALLCQACFSWRVTVAGWSFPCVNYLWGMKRWKILRQHVCISERTIFLHQKFFNSRTEAKNACNDLGKCSKRKIPLGGYPPLT